jgi:tripartite-type tricarboxylate transporter receptor subunit TctC
MKLSNLIPRRLKLLCRAFSSHAALATFSIAACALPISAAAQNIDKKAEAAQPWPTRPVRILVGFPGGSTPDMSARTLAEPLSRALGQPVIVENRVGASGNIAADLIAKATDDHTLGVVINGNLTSAKQLYAKLPYDPARDFAPISLLTTAPLMLVAPSSLPGGAEFFTAARQAGSQWNYGSVGNGSVGHLGMELIKQRSAGMTPVHVPYSGNPQVVTAMLGGQIQMALIPPGIALPHIRSGKLRAIGLTGGRSLLAPDVPPLTEAGLKNVNLEVWTALIGPAGLSRAAQARLAQEVPRIVRDADTRQKLFAQGWQAVGTSPDGLSSRIKEETAILGNIIQTRGIKLE